jgi:phosphatidylethanolamine/phosphatidyl-N-methylethanolamine N-methyltransferase
MNSATENMGAVQLAREFEVTVESSRRGYRLFAPLYDIVFGASLQHGRRLAIDALDCHSGDRILEVCVGSGLSLPLYPVGVRVTGVDISHEMLAKAAQRVTRLGLQHTEALLQMDAEHMSFADATFDKAVVLFGMAGLPDPVRAMNEIERVCRPGARIVVANHFQSRRPLLRVFDGLLSPIYRLLRYRADLDMQVFVAAAGLDVLEARPANLFGYSTVLVCRKRGTGIAFNLVPVPTSC